MAQVVQVLGSLVILAAFIAVQRGTLSMESRLYQAANVVGAAILAVLAFLDRQVGFFLLEATWSLVAAHALWTGRRGGVARAA